MSDWRTLRASVRGAAHRRTGLPNQDAVRIVRCNGDLPLVMALADGHGNAKSFRSQQGARSAVAVMHPIWSHFCTAYANTSQIKRWAEEQLPLELVRRWQERVDRSLRREPFTAVELDVLNPADRDQVAAHPSLAYGSTLLAVLMAPGYMIYLQLGDGDILAVSAAGDVERPLPKDSRLIGNETTSLCAAKAWAEVQVRFQTLAGDPPALILAATDGYANAYRDETAFQQVARDFWTLLRDEGEVAVRPHLKDWLNEVSQQGSGDDVSLGVLWRPLHLSTHGEPEFR
jgi:hypothetical protein